MGEIEAILSLKGVPVKEVAAGGGEGSSGWGDKTGCFGPHWVHEMEVPL